MSDTGTTLTVLLSLTSSPSSPRAALTIPARSAGGSAISSSELRRRASELTSVPLASMKLIFRGRVIPDRDGGDVIEEFKLEEGSVVHVMGKPASIPGGNAVAAAAAPAAPMPAGASVTIPAAQANTATVSGNDSSPMAAALAKLRSSNDGSAYRTAVSTVDKLLGNIVSHPMEEKYRTIKKSNPAFSRRLGALPGGAELMMASGFTMQTKDGVEHYVLNPSADAWPKLVAAREEVRRASAEAEGDRFGAPSAAATSGGGRLSMPGGMPPFLGGMPSPANMSTIQNMLSDPNMMQNMMGMVNDPMVQEMIRADPRFANNPMLQQSLDALRSNPNMLSQISQMMNDPNSRQRMADMMQRMQPSGVGGVTGTSPGLDPFRSGPEEMRRQMEQFQQMSQMFGGNSGGFNARGGGGSGAAVPGDQSGTTTGRGGEDTGVNNSSESSGGDSEMTEEEMIAEAIARSLRES